MQRNQRGTTTMKEMVMRSRKQTLTSTRMGTVAREVIRKGMVARVARKVMRKGTVTRKGMRRGTATRVGLGMREGTTRTLTMPRQNWQWKETATRKGMVVRKGTDTDREMATIGKGMVARWRQKFQQRQP